MRHFRMTFCTVAFAVMFGGSANLHSQRPVLIWLRRLARGGGNSDQASGRKETLWLKLLSERKREFPEVRFNQRERFSGEGKVSSRRTRVCAKQLSNDKKERLEIAL